jgi:hypothetical protein
MWTTVSGRIRSWEFATLKLVLSRVAMVTLCIKIFYEIH